MGMGFKGGSEVWYVLRLTEIHEMTKGALLQVISSMSRSSAVRYYSSTHTQSPSNCWRNDPVLIHLVQNSSSPMSCKLRNSILLCLFFFRNYSGWALTGSYLSCPTAHVSVNGEPSFIASCNHLYYMIILLYKRRRYIVCFEIYSIPLLATTSTCKGELLVLWSSTPKVN